MPRACWSKALSASWVTLSLALVVIPGCRESSKPGATPQAAEQRAPDAVYVVRGRIAQLPDPKDVMSEFRVRHEAIPTFKSDTGEVVGMGSMEMPFPISDLKLLDGLHVGDIIELTFADWYKPTRDFKVTKIVKLPLDTKLELGGK